MIVIIVACIFTLSVSLACWSVHLSVGLSVCQSVLVGQSIFVIILKSKSYFIVSIFCCFYAYAMHLYVCTCTKTYKHTKKDVHAGSSNK